ncbi:MAG: hypothetical protein IKK81_12055 [Prevotella sp.]|nr:hypothetical protein [Prevotella sp.]
MKTMKRFLALLLFFVAAMNVQNLSAQTNGDVNNDGTVNEADITAIIEIMKEANGVGPKKYYWYVGQENPANMTSISPIVGEDVSNGVGFRLLDMNKTYSATNKLYDGLNNPIEGDKSITWYVLLPTTSKLKFYDDLGESPLDIIDTKDFGDGVMYNIYSRTSTRPVATVPVYIY